MTSARTQIEPIVEQRMMKTQFEKRSVFGESDTIAFGPEEIDVPDSLDSSLTLHSNSPLDPLPRTCTVVDGWEDNEQLRPIAAMECSEGTRECPVSVVASVLSDGNHVRLEDGQQRHLIRLAVHFPQVLVFSCVKRSRPSARHNHFRQILRNDVHVIALRSARGWHLHQFKTVSMSEYCDELVLQSRSIQIAPPFSDDEHFLNVVDWSEVIQLSVQRSVLLHS
ncbi:hypothetical protein BLNAU_1419 [Blattamonas nauphoetae]|uniref:Uncharacterized protein n=1 Tax=Blattamonas nauphoetae TaxID=2049346 RepID=A0ABQ9YHZ3_9EUKA|nr:hypothetical protein BLNAU_1419 [Blattamonas nauphoetae]